MREEHRVGLDYLEALTALLQRVQREHPTKGLYQAAEVQFWWSVRRSTDDLGQLFWFDDLGRPAAAVTVTDFGDGSSLVYEHPTLVVMVMPDAEPEWVAHVVERGLAHVAGYGIQNVELEIDHADEVMRTVFLDRGFTNRGEAVVQCWLDAPSRPEISSLHADYRILSRNETKDRPHHLVRPERPDVEERLQQTSLYRSDLDLVVLDRDDNPAAYGLFWYDPVTATGVVEPMRTHDEHQRRGLARHILTTGIDLLARRGAERISIGYEPDNPASGRLYRDVGFVPQKRTDVYAGRTSPEAMAIMDQFAQYETKTDDASR